MNKIKELLNELRTDIKTMSDNNFCDYTDEASTYITLDKLEEAINFTGSSLELPSKEEIDIEAERRNPYVKHMVDWNNGMHEGFIDGGIFILEQLETKRKAIT